MTSSAQQRGFSLVEISVVLVVVATMLAGVLPAITESQKTNSTSETAERMEAIEQALLTFRSGNGRIPCPANNTTAVTDTNFGRESATPGACTGGTPAANYASGGAAVGGVPVKALGLPDEYAFDGWGRRMDYHVTTALTATVTFPTTTAGVYTIRDSAGGSRTTTAAYALVSHGPNGHGAFTRGGTRFNFTTTNDNEEENCDCDNTATYTAYDLILYQYMATPNSNILESFDDVVRYMSRSQLDLVAGSGSSFWMDAGSNNIRNTNSANVGVGIAAPLAPLHTGFAAASGEGIRLSPSAAGNEGGQLSLMDGNGSGGWEIDNFGAAGAEGLRFFRDKAAENPLTSILTLSSAGNVGIGTSAPSQVLEVQRNGTVASLNVLSDVQSQLYLSSPSTMIYLRDSNSSADNKIFRWRTDTGVTNLETLTDALAIKTTAIAVDHATGTVGIGTTTPGGYKLAVEQSSPGSRAFVRFDNTGVTSSSTQLDLGATTGRGWSLINDYGMNNSNDFSIYQGSVTARRLYIDSAGVVSFPAYGAGTLTTNATGVISAASDARLKEDFKPYEKGLDSIVALKPSTYRWTKDSGLADGRLYAGFIAQDVEAVMPEAVDKDARGYRTLQDRPIMAAMVNAIKELNRKVDAVVDGERIERSNQGRLEFPRWLLLLLAAQSGAIIWLIVRLHSSNAADRVR